MLRQGECLLQWCDNDKLVLIQSTISMLMQIIPGSSSGSQERRRRRRLGEGVQQDREGNRTRGAAWSYTVTCPAERLCPQACHSHSTTLMVLVPACCFLSNVSFDPHNNTRTEQLTTLHRQGPRGSGKVISSRLDRDYELGTGLNSSLRGL